MNISELKENPTVFSEFLQSRWSEFHAAASGYTSMNADACVQEAFLKALHKANTFKGENESQLVSWVKRIVINECISHLRKKSNQGNAPLPVVEPSHNESPSRNLRIEEEQQLLAVALSLLNERQREAVIFNFLQGLSHQEISTITGDTPGAVRAVVHRGVQKLKQLLGDATFSAMLSD